MEAETPDKPRYVARFFVSEDEALEFAVHHDVKKVDGKFIFGVRDADGNRLEGVAVYTDPES